MSAPRFTTIDPKDLERRHEALKKVQRLCWNGLDLWKIADEVGYTESHLEKVIVGDMPVSAELCARVENIKGHEER